MVSLTEEQRKELSRRAHERGITARTRDRLEMVRLSDAGWSVPRIARHFGGGERKVRRWIKAYLSAEMVSDGHSGSGGFDALADKTHPGRKSGLTKEMLAGLRAEIGKGDRTWTVHQMGEWVLETYGVPLGEERLRLHAKRAGLSWQRTSRNLKHKQNPEEVQERRATLQTLEKGGMPG